MARGRPKNLSSYEKVKVKKMRDILSKLHIKRFNTLNDANLLKTLYIDSSDRVYVNIDFFDDSINRIEKFVREFTE
jgi:hypothetical protein